MCGGIISLLEYYNRHAKGYSNRHGDAVISWELLKTLLVAREGGVGVLGGKEGALAEVNLLHENLFHRYTHLESKLPPQFLKQIIILNDTAIGSPFIIFQQAISISKHNLFKVALRCHTRPVLAAGQS
jgi:hypothetical protein